MEAWCLGAFISCGAAIVAGMVCMYRARGRRIVSGRPWATLAYVSLFAAVVLIGLICSLFSRIFPVLSANPEGSRLLTSLFVAAGPILLLALACMWVHARSMGRSIVFHNVRRDDLAIAVTDALRQLGVSCTHRLRTFRDEFIMSDAHIIVHDAIGLSRFEWIGSNQQMRTQIEELAIARLRTKLNACGQDLRDERHARLALA